MLLWLRQFYKKNVASLLYCKLIFITSCAFWSPHSLNMTPPTVITITSLAGSSIKRPPHLLLFWKKSCALEPQIWGWGITPVFFGPWAKWISYIFNMTSSGSCHPCSKSVLCNIPVVLFYRMILAVIVNVYFRVRVCGKILASSSMILNLSIFTFLGGRILIWKIGILMPTWQINLESWKGKCTICCVQPSR